MPVDLSMFDTKPVEPTNPLQMLTQLQALQRGALQNQILQRTMTSQQAQGRAYASAVDPTTGKFDPDRARLLASQDPNAEYGMQGVADDTQNLSSSMTTQHIAQVQSAMAQADRLNTIIGSVLSTAVGPDGKPDPTKLTDDVLKSGFQQAAEAGVDPKVLASEQASMPLDPRARYQVLQQHLVAGQQALAQARLIYGDVTQTDTGPTIESARVPGLGGTLPTYTKGIAPALVTTVDPKTGQGGFANAQDIVANPGAYSSAQPTQVAASQHAAGATAGQTGAQLEASIQAEVPQLMQNKAAFRSIHADIANGMQNGPGAEARNDLLKVLQLGGLNVSADKIANTEDAVKNLARVVLNTPGATNSDKQQAQAIAANPSIAKSTQGFARLVSMVEGYTSAKLATANGLGQIRANNRNLDASQIPLLQSRLSQEYDASLFQYNALDPQYRHTMTDNMPDGLAFIKRYNQAKAAGWFDKGLGN
jgi:hypothetical protein